MIRVVVRDQFNEHKSNKIAESVAVEVREGCLTVLDRKGDICATFSPSAWISATREAD